MPKKPKENWFKAFWLNRNKRSAVTLAGLFLVIAILLGVANNFIEPIAIEIEEAATEYAMEDLFPSAESFEPINSPNVNFFGELATIESIQEALDAYGETIGYVVLITAHAELGVDIEMMVGIRDVDGFFWDTDSILRISRVEITAMPDVVGTAARADVAEFILQFGGLTEIAELITIDTPILNQVLSIPGADSVSYNITYAINHAFSAVQTIVADEMLTRAQAEQIIDVITTDTDIQLGEVAENGYLDYIPYYSQGGDN